jgi:hypothetical protein
MIRRFDDSKIRVFDIRIRAPNHRILSNIWCVPWDTDKIPTLKIKWEGRTVSGIIEYVSYVTPHIRYSNIFGDSVIRCVHIESPNHRIFESSNHRIFETSPNHRISNLSESYRYSIYRISNHRIYSVDRIIKYSIYRIIESSNIESTFEYLSNSSVSLVESLGPQTSLLSTPTASQEKW